MDREAVIDVGLYGTFPPTGDLGMISEMAAAGAAGFKVSTIEVDPIRFPRIPDGRLYEAFGEISLCSSMTCQGPGVRCSKR